MFNGYLVVNLRRLKVMVLEMDLLSVPIFVKILIDCTFLVSCKKYIRQVAGQVGRPWYIDKATSGIVLLVFVCGDFNV